MILTNMADLFLIINLHCQVNFNMRGLFAGGVSTKLPAEKPYYFDQNGRVVLKSQQLDTAPLCQVRVGV